MILNYIFNCSMRVVRQKWARMREYRVTYLQFRKQCLLENIQGEFEKICPATFNFEESS